MGKEGFNEDISKKLYFDKKLKKKNYFNIVASCYTNCTKFFL